MPFAIEAKTVEDADSVDLEYYRFERYSESKAAYIFVKRQR